jgi:type II secretory pathway pseudopilin PulG
MARTAVVSNRVSRRQAGRWAEQDQAAAYQQQQQQMAYQQQQAYAAPPPAPEPSQDDTLEQLQKLGELRAAGVLTDAEFEAQKAKLLSR